MATFNMSGDAGVFVKTNPYEQRKKAYYEYGLNKVLGDFVGSVQQNTATFNKIKTVQTMAPSPLAPQQPSPFTLGTPAPSGQTLTSPSVTPKVAAPSPYAPPVSQPLTTKAPPSANPVGQSNAYVEAVNNPAMNSMGQTAVPGKTPTNTAGGLNSGGITPVQKTNAIVTQPQAQTPQQSVNFTPDQTTNAAGQVYKEWNQGTNNWDVKNADGSPIDQVTFQQMGLNIDHINTKEVTSAHEAEYKAIEEATGGTTTAFDINAAIDNNSDVILARENANRAKEQADAALQRNLDTLALDNEYDIADAKQKAVDLKAKLLADLERRGLALSGFKDTGLSSISAEEQAEIDKTKNITTLKSMNEQAETLAKKENIELDLATIIVRAANTEYKRMRDEEKARQQAIDDFLKSQGLVVNPLTGEVLTTASERRAIESAQRADERFQMSQDAAARADAQFAMTQARFEAFLNDQADKGMPTISDVIPKPQQAALIANGISKDLYSSLTWNLANGMPLNGSGGIREQMIAQYGQAEANRILDYFDKTVGISKIESGSIFQPKTGVVAIPSWITQ